MKDKEKQIEEMAKIMLYSIQIPDEITSAVKVEEIRKAYYLPVLNYAIRLYNAGYRKLPEDSVVLSMEDKAKFVHIDTLKNIKSISQLKELLNNITAINDLMGYNDRELEIRQEERKETAEYFLKEYGYLLSQRAKDEIAKQFGVEIKE